MNYLRSLDEATGWFVANQELFIQYAVNIVAAFLILFIGLFLSLKWSVKGLHRIFNVTPYRRNCCDILRVCLGALYRYCIHFDFWY